MRQGVVLSSPVTGQKWKQKEVRVISNDWKLPNSLRVVNLRPNLGGAKGEVKTWFSLELLNEHRNPRCMIEQTEPVAETRAGLCVFDEATNLKQEYLVQTTSCDHKNVAQWLRKSM